MERIAVVTDTGSNLSFAQAKELGIYLLPLQITIDETTLSRYIRNFYPRYI